MLRLYSTLTRTVQPFKPLKKGKINLFVCGVTTYDYAHIGHAKSYVQFDVIARYLRYKGYKLFYLQNVTDIDDKIIDRAKETNQNALALSKQYEKEYHQDMKALKVISVTRFARATDYIPQLINQIKRLMQQGFAYEIADGIYFDIETFKGYGKLSQQPLGQLTNHRIAADINKHNPGDFVIWKKHKLGEPFWNSPWGEGRPGWHIEDTAITEHFFGPQYDIHGGGIDLIFPHHEAEIALMESLSKKPLVNYWLHNGFLLINNEKMSKSLNNFITIRDAIEKWGAMAVRFLFATSHYRSAINFTEESMRGAQSAIETLQNALRDAKQKLNDAKAGKTNKSFIKKLESFKSTFMKEMDDDFNTPRATAALFDIAHALNTAHGSKQTLKEALTIFTDLIDVFGLILEEKITIPETIRELVRGREQARKDKDWGKADSLRLKIQNAGFIVDDSDKGPIIKKNKIRNNKPISWA